MHAQMKREREGRGGEGRDTNQAPRAHAQRPLSSAHFDGESVTHTQTRAQRERMVEGKKKRVLSSNEMKERQSRRAKEKKRRKGKEKRKRNEGTHHTQITLVRR